MRKSLAWIAALVVVAGVVGGQESFAGKPPPPPPPPAPADPAIAYSSSSSTNFSFGDLMVMNADGTNATAILKQTAATRGKNPKPATNYGQPDWSPDGRKLVCVSNNIYGPGIYVVNRDGTGLHIIVSLSPVGLAFINPVWSPAPVPGIGGGKHRIAFTRPTPIGSSEAGDVWIVDEDGQNAVNVSNTPGAEFFPTWSPSGTRLLCQTFRDDGSGNSSAIRDRYGLMDFMTGTFTDVQYPAPLVGHYVRRPSWSKTQENVIVVEGTNSPMDVWRVDLSGFAVPVNLTNTSDQGENCPSLSPGDDAIVFTSAGGIEVMNADGTGRHSIRSPGVDPSWRRNP